MSGSRNKPYYAEGKRLIETMRQQLEGEEPLLLADNGEKILTGEITVMQDLAHEPGTDCFSGVDWDNGAPPIRMFKKVVASP